MRAVDAAVAVALVGLAALVGLSGPGAVPEPVLEMAPDPGEPIVTVGPVAERLVLTGELRATDSEIFTVPIAATWQVQLKWLIEEGARVEPGDVIARFDPSGTQDRLDEAENRLIEKRRELELKRAESEQKQLQFELELARAQAEFDKAAIEASIPEGVLKGSEFRDKQLEYARAQRKLKDAQEALTAGELMSGAELFGLQLDVADLEFDIERYEKQLASLELRAHRPGIVVHATHPWWGRKVREGDRLQATMRVASIPNLSTLEVEAWATEAEVSRLAPGQPARLALDALPRTELTGRVIRVAPKGEPRRQWGRAPYFRVRIALDERDESVMRPGMSVRCDVLVRSVDDLPRVPVDRLGRAGGAAWVRTAAGEAIPVEVVAEGPLLAAVRPVDGARLPEGMRLAEPGPPPAPEGS